MTRSEHRTGPRYDVAAALALVGLVLGLAVSGCSGSDPTTSAGDDVNATSRLERQRLSVRDLARALRAEVEDTLGGSTLEATGGWDSCGESRPAGDPSGLRYLARVRLSASAPPGADLVSALEDLADGVGLSRLDRVEPEKVRARDGDVEVSLWSLPPGGTGDVLVSVHGPCVELPEAERDDWAERRRGDDPL